MKHLNIILLLSILICGSFHAEANVDETTLNSLKQKVAQAQNGTDSLAALYNLFDASITKEKENAGWELIALAKRHDLQDVLHDIIPQMSTLSHRDDNTQKKLLVESEFIRDTDQRKGVKLFIEVVRATNDALYLPDDERKKTLLKYAKADMVATGDYYQDLLDLYRVVIFMGKFTESNLYLEYLTRLENMIAKLPEHDYPVKNMFYTTAANTHTAKSNYAKALESDSILLNIITDLETKYNRMGREYRNYDRFKYICYRRMLSNYPGLTAAKAREIYENCDKLAQTDIEAAYDMKMNNRPLAFLLMKEGRYAEAIAPIKKGLHDLRCSSKMNSNHYMKLLGMLVEAADSTGDKATLLESTKEYNKLLLAALRNQSEESYNELQMRYDVNNLRNEKTQLEIDKRDSEIATSQKVVSLILGALLILAIMLMILYKNHFSLRQKTRELRSENEKLHQYLETLINQGKPTGSAELRKRNNQ